MQRAVERQNTLLVAPCESPSIAIRSLGVGWGDVQVWFTRAAGWSCCTTDGCTCTDARAAKDCMLMHGSSCRRGDGDGRAERRAMGRAWREHPVLRAGLQSARSA
jgi:hypothetical protein